MKIDLLICNGLVFDGSGNEPEQAHVAIKGDRIVWVGKESHSSRGIPANSCGQAIDDLSLDARQVIDASGLAVAPGFINVLSHAWQALIHDGRSMSDIYQGVTLEVIGEGVSVAPINESIRREMLHEQGDIKFDITWRSLDEFFRFITDKGISCNIASFVGATTIRMNELDSDDRHPTEDELSRMRALVRSAMEDGAVGLSSALIYAPACFARTEELIELAREAGSLGGIYISHLRSEGEMFLESLEELIEIATRAAIPAEVHHLKAAGRKNWGKMDSAISIIESKRAKGLKLTANMYTYTAAHTGLDAAMPTWVQEGGLRKWIERLQDPHIRRRVQSEMLTESRDWENGYLHAGPDNIRLIGFKNDRLKNLTGMTLAEIAQQRGADPTETAIDLVIEDGSRVETVFGWMCEENVRKEIVLPYMSFGSDGMSLAPEGVFLRSSTHPRAYGNFARLLGRYVRDEKLISLAEAIRRLTSLPATNLSLKDRGWLKPGCFADIVVFDPDTVSDLATFENPHQLAVGMKHVFVNGTAVLKDGCHTGALPGRAVYGPGRRSSPS